MSDYMVRALARQSGVRGLACLTTGIAEEAARRQQTSPAGRTALAYGLTGAALLGAMLKVQQRVAIKVEGDGALRKLVAEADSYGHLRGYLLLRENAAGSATDPADVAAIIGQAGQLTVVKDLRLRELHESVVPLQTGHLDADLTYYLMMSEQIPSFVEIDAPVDGQGRLRAAGGLLLQLLPDGDLATLARMAEMLDDLPPIGELLANGETPQEILARLFTGQEYEILEVGALDFRCTCSRARSRQALALAGRAEVALLLAEGEAVIDCHFCQERYVFDRSELAAILEELAETA
jgi:molecular chaperone Hsp33